MSALIHSAAADANEIVSGFRATLINATDVVEATALLSIAASMTILLNVLF